MSQGSTRTICTVWYSVISWEIPLPVSTGHRVQLLGIFGFFLLLPYVGNDRKSLKMTKSYPVWPVETGNGECIFFRKWNLNFQKIGKNTKKIVKIPKKIKMKLVLCIVWYIFFSDFIIDVLIFKKIFFWIFPISKKVRGTPVPPTYGSTVKNLTLPFWPKTFSWLPYMYRNSPRKFGRKSQC